MGKECVVFGCANRDTDKQLGLKFHRIPRDEPRRTRWMNVIKRSDPNTGKDWTPGDDGARVCSEHFIEGRSLEICLKCVNYYSVYALLRRGH